MLKVDSLPHVKIRLMMPEEVHVGMVDGEPFYEEHRCALPFDEFTVLNMMDIGCVDPVSAVNIDGKAWMYKGRQRRTNLIEANRRLKEKGIEPKMLKVEFLKVDKKLAEFINISTNNLRLDYSPLEKVSAAQKLLAIGYSEEQVAATNRISVQQLKNWLKSDTLCASVKKAIEQGKISITAATKFADKPAGEQQEALKEALESGVRPSVRNVERIVKGKAPTKRKVEKKGMWSREELFRISTHNATPNAFQIFLGIIIGEMEEEDWMGVEGLEWMKDALKGGE